MCLLGQVATTLLFAAVSALLVETVTGPANGSEGGVGDDEPGGSDPGTDLVSGGGDAGELRSDLLEFDIAEAAAE